METGVEGGAGGFCTFVVLPPQAARTAMIAADRSKRIILRIATANLLICATNNYCTVPRK
jgi:hypothetical protein